MTVYLQQEISYCIYFNQFSAIWVWNYKCGTYGSTSKVLGFTIYVMWIHCFNINLRNMWRYLKFVFQLPTEIKKNDNTEISSMMSTWKLIQFQIPTDQHMHKKCRRFTKPTKCITQHSFIIILYIHLNCSK